MSNIVSLKAKRPNMLFEQWLTEWMHQAGEPKRKCYETALLALQKFPLPLATGKECIILKGFGEKLCNQLDAKLRAHKNPPATVTKPRILINNTEITENNVDMLDLQKDLNIEFVQTAPQKAKQTNAKPSKAYCPAYRSGGYAILCALYKFHLENPNLNKPAASESSFMTKKDLISVAQEVCDKSFTKKEQGCVYTAWSSMSTLISKQLVKKDGNPAKFQLTEAGVEVAKPLYTDAINDAQNENFLQNLTTFIGAEKDVVKTTEKVTKKTKIVKTPSSSSLGGNKQDSENVTQETVIFSPGTFKILLIVDKQETSGSTKKDYFDEILVELNNLCVNYEVRHLKIGDYAWICQHMETQQELVLPYIVERKRMDDFGASIKDGRFHEQKFRLKQSGIENLIYLVESHDNNTHCGMPLSSIYQAATNTLVQDKFSVKFTENIQKTAEYLAVMTNLLSKLFSKKTIMNCSKDDLQKCVLGSDLIGLMAFKEFNLSSSKNKVMKVSDMFVKQLLQLHGISVDKALAIVAKYPTPRLLKGAYDKCTSEKDADGMLANLEFGTLNKKIGPVISTTIYQLYNFKDY